MILKVANGLGIKAVIAEFSGMYMEPDEKGPGKNVYFYKTNKEGNPIQPEVGDEPQYDKPFNIHPDKTLIMARGLGSSVKHGNRSWWVTIKNLEEEGYTVINSTKCHDICSDKWYNQVVFHKNDFNTPDTVLIRNQQDAGGAAEKLNNKFPMILKTSTGSRGVGVMWVENLKSLHSMVQLLHRDDPYVDMILQEFIKTKYDFFESLLKMSVQFGTQKPIDVCRENFDWFLPFFENKTQ